MGKDGNMYYVDPTASLEVKGANYDRAAEVFNSSQGVLTHTAVHHHEAPNLHNLAVRKPHNHGNNTISNRSNATVRPQSSRRVCLTRRSSTEDTR